MPCVCSSCWSLARAVALAGLSLLGGCHRAAPAGRGDCDVQAPSQGETERFLIDGLSLPGQRSDFADDLDGDGRADNQLGNLVALARGAGYQPSRAAAAMLASGALSPRLEVIRGGDTVAVRWHKRDQDSGVDLGGRLLAGGAIRTSRTRCTRHPVEAAVLLPLLPDADPVDLHLDGVEIDLDRDGDGVRGVLRGAARPADYEAAAHRAIVAMVRNRPVEHRLLRSLLDRDGDGELSLEELRRSVLFSALARPDVRLRGAGGAWAPVPAGRAPDALSIAFAFHAHPCASVECPRSVAAPACDDRIRNGQETGTDCGGACPPCPGGAVCRTANDCQSGDCRDGTCAEPTCHDGRTGGAESDVDCGGSCLPCGTGRACRDDADCLGACRAGRCAPCRGDGDCHALLRTSCALGLCLPPSCGNGRRDGRESDVDCGGGDCPPCRDGHACRDEADCADGECENFRCGGKD